MNFKDENKHTYTNLICMVLIIVFLFSFAIINFIGLNRIFDADMYADTLISKYIWESKSIFPDGWVFGNQCFVIGTPVIAALVFGICNDIFLSMKIATTIVTIIIVGVFVWAIKPIVKKKYIYIGVLILLSSAIGCEIGKQFEGQLFFLTVSYYSSYMITLLITGGCYIRILTNTKLNGLITLISLFFSMACGMQSLRQTALMVIPLIMCCAIYRKKELIKYALLITLFNIAGIILIKLIGPSFHTIYGSSTISSPKDWLESIRVGFDAIKKISGIRWLLKGNCVGLYGLFLFSITALSILLSLFNKEKSNIAPLIYYFLFGMLSTIGASVITTVNLRYIYIFSYFPLVSISFIYLIDRLEKKNNKTSEILGVLLTLSLFAGSLLNWSISYLPEVYEFMFIEDKSIEKEIGNYINENNYKYVYGSWEKLGKTMSYIDGDVIGGSFYSDEPFKIVSYLNTNNIYSEKNNDSAIYILYDYEIEKATEYANTIGATLNRVKEFNNKEIQLYIYQINN